MKTPDRHRFIGGRPGDMGTDNVARVTDPAAPTNARPPASRRADPHEVLWARAETRAYLIREGEIDRPLAYIADFARDVGMQVRRKALDFHQAVDALYQTAVHSGLVDEIGDDEVQSLLSDAFGWRSQSRAAAA